MEETNPNDIITDEEIIASARQSAVKPGYKTTEFWLTIAANVLPIVQGFLMDGSPEAQVLASAVAVLATIGYTASRTLAKK